MTDPDVWYVSYRTNITPKRDDGERRSARATRKFKTEADAKQFAHEMIKGRLERDCWDLEPTCAEENGGIDANSRLDCWYGQGRSITVLRVGGTVTGLNPSLAA